MPNRRNRSLPFVLVAALGFPACRSAPIEDRAPPIARLAGASADTGLLEAGRSIYTGQCVKCHKAKPVMAFSAEDWSGRIIPKMAKKAKLSTGETEAVLAYVLAAGGSQTAPGPRESLRSGRPPGFEADLDPRHRP